MDLATLLAYMDNYPMHDSFVEIAFLNCNARGLQEVVPREDEVAFATSDPLNSMHHAACFFVSSASFSSRVLAQLASDVVQQSKLEKSESE